MTFRNSSRPVRRSGFRWRSRCLGHWSARLPSSLFVRVSRKTGRGERRAVLRGISSGPCTWPDELMGATPRMNESEVMSEHSSSGDSNAQAHSTADAVARRSYGKLVAFLAARTKDVAAAEDALSEAFLAALADWPINGCPSTPEAWLLTVARRKIIDGFRGQRRHELANEELKVMTEGLDAAAADAEIPDQRLALLFACAHPAIDVRIRAPLMLH